MIDLVTARLPVVTLRPAVAGDCERVWQWNFAPEVRARSRSSHVVSLADHTRWYERRLAAGAFWIVEYEHAPVGTVRIDDGRISIALAADVRRRGIGRRAIRTACAAWGKPVIAEIRTDNAASRACFEACAFRLHHEADDLATYTWRP
jgi:RimJ/RimL family protein N-acetyltransferase